MHSDSSEASTLPPDSTAQTWPSGGGHAALHQRRHGNRAGALDHLLGALEQHHHRLGDLVVRDGDDLVHVALDQRQREVARALDRDAVADRVRRARADRPVGGQRVDVGGARLRLYAHDAGARQPLGHRQPDAGGQPAAAERHDHQPRLGRLARDLQPDRALTRHDLGLVEGVHRGQALFLDEPRGLRVRVVVVAAVEAHLAAVLAHRGDLRHRRLLRHHQHRPGAGVASGARRPPARGCRRSPPRPRRAAPCRAAGRSCWSRRAP